MTVRKVSGEEFYKNVHLNGIQPKTLNRFMTAYINRVGTLVGVSKEEPAALNEYPQMNYYLSVQSDGQTTEVNDAA